MKPIQPIVTLQENASQFFEKIFLKNESKMECKKGCSQCCMTDISIFQLEADRITDYVQSLDKNQQLELKERFLKPEKTGACVFLIEDECSIYSARPLICRTQGLPLFLSSENSLDFCPLNFKDGNPDKEDWLNLERMNTLLAIAAKSVKKEDRVRLKKLKKEILLHLN